MYLYIYLCAYIYIYTHTCVRMIWLETDYVDLLGRFRSRARAVSQDLQVEMQYAITLYHNIIYYNTSMLQYEYASILQYHMILDYIT